MPMHAFVRFHLVILFMYSLIYISHILVMFSSGYTYKCIQIRSTAQSVSTYYFDIVKIFKTINCVYVHSVLDTHQCHS